MYRTSIIACVILMLSGVRAAAQSQSLPPDLATLPEEIKTLKWQAIDLSTVPVVERSRSLMLMNHVLDELSATASAEADLMSSYLEKQNLGAQFASTPPPPPPQELTFADAQKVAIAMLRGPMSKSYYASELGDVSANGLASYAQMYQRTCQRRWSELQESRHQVRAMSSFLGNSQKMQDYESWATAETALRQKQYEQRAEASHALRPQPPNPAEQAQVQKLDQENRQLQQALASVEQQQRMQAAQAQQAGQAQAAAQQQQQQQQEQGQPASSTEYVAGVPAYGTYGVYGAYGGYAAAAHYANCSYQHDEAYGNYARGETERRMSSFHGAPAARAAGRR